MKINRTLIKCTNWALAGILSMLGFTGCLKEPTVEYGMPHADYTVKGKVVNKATGKPVLGIRVTYNSGNTPEYGIPSTPYAPKSSVITDANGTFKLTEKSYNLYPYTQEKIPVFVEDIDGEENGLFHPEIIEVDFRNAEQTGKRDHWYEGEYTVTLNVELTEIEPENQ